jgi:GNAT superfamily N-acetyltransferase
MPVSTREAPVSLRLFQIRPAVLDDLDQLCELASHLLTNIRAEGTTEDARRVFEYIMNAEDRGLIVVGDNNKGGLCGYAYASYQWRAEFCGETMDIVALFVAPQWRGKGVGSGLIASLLANAKQRGIRRVSAEVHPGNAAIERTLESGGFDPERRTLWGYRVG